jgi:hypothetical protein
LMRFEIELRQVGDREIMEGASGGSDTGHHWLIARMARANHHSTLLHPWSQVVPAGVCAAAAAINDPLGFLQLTS